MNLIRVTSWQGMTLTTHIILTVIGLVYTLDHFMLSPSLTGAPEVRVAVTHPVDNTSDHDPVTFHLPGHIDRIRSMPAEYMRSFAWHKCPIINN